MSAADDRPSADDRAVTDDPAAASGRASTPSGAGDAPTPSRTSSDPIAPSAGAEPAAVPRWRDLSTPAEGEEREEYPPVAPDPAAAQVHRRGIVRAYVGAVVAGIVLDVVVIVIALVLGGPAVPSALLGTALALVISVPSLIPAVLGLDKGVATFAVLVLGVWLVKMIVLVGGVILVRGIEGLEMPWVGLALLAGGLASLLTEAVVLLRIRTDPAGSVRAGEL